MNSETVDSSKPSGEAVVKQSFLNKAMFDPFKPTWTLTELTINELADISPVATS